MMARHDRESMLKDLGYTQSEIADAVRIIRKAKERRKTTVLNLGSGAQAMEETIEAATRRIKNFLTFGRNK